MEVLYCKVDSSPPSRRSLGSSRNRRHAILLRDERLRDEPKECLLRRLGRFVFLSYFASVCKILSPNVCSCTVLMTKRELERK